jgi:hypothetical protein
MILDTLIDAFYKLLDGIANFIMTYLPKIIAAVIILMVASYLARRGGNWWSGP